ncbi:hypothetical protein EL22_24140 [Halostagnicola sp. A56]|uniref:M24 family metallopeptidase n=1 Tax=Halostagnicola sp. A56 TaxID=1495067 RepID=UPI0004A00938|nr:M24 family metallopeptidase [Halostagnicola sp. A56]KDE59169.1 hypothetical protein EL22_24140 [Halostagnicola sp. A56]
MSERVSPTARVASTLSSRDAAAFVHAGPSRDPAVRYCLRAIDSSESAPAADSFENDPTTGSFDTTHAVAFDGTQWHHVSWRGVPEDWPRHPADELATRLADDGVSGPVLAPATIPHDAALYLEQTGFTLASSDILTRSRRSKTDLEHELIEQAQQATAAGVKRAATVLAESDSDDEGALLAGETRLTDEQLRIAVDEAIVAAGSLPDGRTRVTGGMRNDALETSDNGTGRGDDRVRASTDSAGVSDGLLRAGEPITVVASPRGREGYHGGLVRTFVVDGDGGDSRRAHVALTQAFRSVRSMLTDATHSITAVEAELEAEIRAYGFGEADAIETRVTGVGLEPREAPAAADSDVGPETVVRIEATVRVGDGRSVRIADLLAPGRPAQWLATPSRSLEPAAYADAEPQ